MSDRISIPLPPSFSFNEGTAYRVRDVGRYMGEKYHELGWFGQGVSIALVDSGVGPDDRCGHGSAMREAILSVAPQAKIDSYRVLDDEGNGDMDRLEEILNSLVGKGYDIVNLSLGRDLDCGGICYSCHAVQRLAEEGVHVFAAIGNNADTNNIPNCPAVSLGAMSVGGENIHGDPTAFTVAGWSLNGRLHPMIQAPSGDGVLRIPEEWIIVNVPTGSTMDGEFPDLPPGKGATRGSSVGTALISGLAALQVSAGENPREFHGLPPAVDEPSLFGTIMSGVSKAITGTVDGVAGLGRLAMSSLMETLGEMAHDTGEELGNELNDQLWT